MISERSLIIAACGILLPLTGPALAQDTPPAPPVAPPAAAASPAPAADIPEVVAEINGEKITREQAEAALNQALSQSGRSLGDLPPEARAGSYRMITEQLVTERAVNAEASKIKVSDADVDAEMKKLAEQMGGEDAMKKEITQAGETMESAKKQLKESLQQQRWLDQKVGDRAKVTEADAKAFYEAQPDQFKAAEMVRASHILIAIPTGADDAVIAEKKALAEKAKARVDKGEDFAAVAKELSEDPGSKQNGGDLDFFTQDRMVPEFATAAFAMKKGEVSEPVKSQFGFHVIKVTDTKEARTVPFDEAKQRIIDFLGEQKKREIVQKEVAAVRAKSDAKIFLPEMKMPAPAATAGAGAAPASTVPADASGTEAAPADAPTPGSM